MVIISMALPNVETRGRQYRVHKTLPRPLWDSGLPKIYPTRWYSLASLTTERANAALRGLLDQMEGEAQGEGLCGIAHMVPITVKGASLRDLMPIAPR